MYFWGFASQVETRFFPRGESREGIPNIWIMTGERTAHSSSSRFFTPPSPPFIFTIFATAFLAHNFWGLLGGFNPSSFGQNRGSLPCWIKRTPGKGTGRPSNRLWVATGKETKGLTVATTSLGVAETIYIQNIQLLTKSYFVLQNFLFKKHTVAVIR